MPQENPWSWGRDAGSRDDISFPARCLLTCNPADYPGAAARERVVGKWTGAP